jgi:hypothetical protein
MNSFSEEISQREGYELGKDRPRFLRALHTFRLGSLALVILCLALSGISLAPRVAARDSKDKE